MSRKLRGGGERSEEQQLLQAEEEETRRKEETVPQFMQGLVCDLQKAELQDAQVQQSHLQHLESQTTQLDKHITMVQKQWDRTHQDLNSTFSSVMDKVLCGIQQQRAWLQEKQLCAKRDAEERTAEDQKYNRTLDQLQSQQEDQVQQSYLQHLESLMTQQDKLRKMLQEEWDSTLQDINSTFSSEMDKLLCGIQQQRAWLQEKQLCAKRNAEERTAEDQKECNRTLDQLQSQQEDQLLMKTGYKKLKDMTPQSLEDLQTSQHETKTLNKDMSQNKRISKNLRRVSGLKDRLVQPKRDVDSEQVDDVQVLRAADVSHKLQSKQEVPTMEHGQTFCGSEELQRRQLLRNQNQDLIQQDHQLQQNKDGPLMVSPVPSPVLSPVPPDTTSAAGTALCGGSTEPPAGPTGSDP
ncbi:trichohyalin [Austrofundulus limnaeus]|uniref:Trichohyalin n=1 Tax=Austrofundulus limnaeus TaxID=52670 RepID=A0A2I4DCT6_AUSLI|nr:PREDICTED: trichohyalin-like [Austrofundulus limnaeus]